MWYDSMQNAIKQTIIISEILDTRTRHLIQACARPQTFQPAVNLLLVWKALV